MELKMALWCEAMGDATFRSQLLANPTAAAASLPQHASPPKPLPPVNWEILEDSPATTYIVVPPPGEPVAWDGLTGTNLGAAFQDASFIADLQIDATTAVENRFGIVLPPTMTVEARFETYYDRAIVLQDDLSSLYHPSNEAVNVYHASSWCGRTIVCRHSCTFSIFVPHTTHRNCQPTVQLPADVDPSIPI
ncbi:MAG: hypothetical protein AAF211_11055 [Myxococcota bacterium]